MHQKTHLFDTEFYLARERRRLSFLESIRPNRLADPLHKLLGPNEPRALIRTNGIQYFCSPTSHTGRVILDEGQYEPVTMRILKNLLVEGSVFVDIGAHDGLLSSVAASLIGTTGHLVAIEPQQDIFRVLQVNVALNAKCKYDLFLAAISNETGTGKINLTSLSNTGGSSLVRPVLLGRTAPVKLLTFADACQQADINYIDLVKIDVEGLEDEVVESIVSSNINVSSLLLDYHAAILAKRDISPIRIHQRLTAEGYRRADGKEGIDDNVNGHILYWKRGESVEWCR